MVKKNKLFGDDENVTPAAPASGSEFKVNQEFAEKYDKREKKKLLKKSKEMEPEEESSEYSDEDSEGVLINDKVEQRFMETIARIRANDPKLKDTKDELFKDEDFEVEKIAPKEKEEKPVTFKTMMAEKVKKKFGENLEKNIDEVEDTDSENSDGEPKKETDVQLQKRLKADFIAAADSDSDSDLLTAKPKSKSELKKEKEDIDKYTKDQEQKKYDEDQILKEFWGNSAQKKLTPEDRFLRSYILGEKWKEKADELDPQADEEDFERDSEMEEFEENYNFRFEERDGDKIRTYPRTIEDTYRIARNRRMENKIAKKKRMKEYLKDKKKEREQIAALKKSEIIERIQEAEKVSFSDLIFIDYWKWRYCTEIIQRARD